MIPSKIQTTEAMCYICKKYLNVETRTGIEIHHCIHGRGLRKLADQDGLTIWICRRHHSELHDNPQHPYDKELKALAQKTYINEQRKKGMTEEIARDMFLQRYGRFWDYE